jgi:hypothetical protein
MLPNAQLVVRSIVTLAGPGPLLATGSTADTHWLSPFASGFGPLQSLRCRKNIVNSWKRRATRLTTAVPPPCRYGGG